MDFHPYCELFPLHNDTVRELAENMEVHGCLFYARSHPFL